MRYLITATLLCLATLIHAQSKTTEDLHKKNSEALALFFYNNTLRMINQTDDKDFDALIKDIEKMKFLMIDKAKFPAAEYRKLVSSYKSESFEEIMTSRFNGKNFDIFLKEVNGKTKGVVVAVNDEKSLMILDIVGSIALDKVTKFVSTLDDTTEIGKKIKDFTSSKDEQ